MSSGRMIDEELTGEDLKDNVVTYSRYYSSNGRTKENHDEENLVRIVTPAEIRERNIPNTSREIHCTQTCSVGFLSCLVHVKTEIKAIS
jgi:hypothetical protein